MENNELNVGCGTLITSLLLQSSDPNLQTLNPKP